MNTEKPYKLFRGRPIKDAAWNALVAPSPHVIENDEDEEQVLLDIVKHGRRLPRGCTNTFRGTAYCCKMYLGGAQRHIAKGTLYQCAKFYDYALIFFDKYRVRKAVTQFNFDRADAVSDMLREPAISEYLGSLEKYLLDSGALTLPVDTSEARKEKQRARSYKRTIAGTIQAFADRIEPYIFEIANQNDELAKRITGLEAKLDAILKNSLTSPADAPIVTSS